MRLSNPADPPLSPRDGRIVITAPAPGRPVGIVNRRLHDIGPALAGRPWAEAPRLARLLLPVCGWGQGLACLTALEAAQGVVPPAGTAVARALLAQAEVAVGLVWRAALEWPELLGRPAQLACLTYARKAQDALVAALWGLADPLDPAAQPAAPSAASPAVAAIIEAVETAVIPRAPLATGPAEAWATWAGQGAAPLAALVRAGRALSLPPVSDDPPLPGLATLAAALAADPGFGAAPGVAGGPAAPASALPLPTRLAARMGPVGARYLATARMARQVAEGLRALQPRPIDALALGPGLGAARVCGHRGALVHLVRVDAQGRIALFRSVAPTEWLLHPEGALRRTLSALPPGGFRAAAPLVTAAFDPCAPVDVWPAPPVLLDA